MSINKKVILAIILGTSIGVSVDFWLIFHGVFPNYVPIKISTMTVVGIAFI